MQQGLVTLAGSQLEFVTAHKAMLRARPTNYNYYYTASKVYRFERIYRSSDQHPRQSRETRWNERAASP
jgi:hypothetical protein